MARYISEFNLTKPYEEIYAIVSKYLIDNGYEFRNYEYENVFKKGNNIISTPCFIKISFSDNKMKLEAWHKSGIGVDVLYGEKMPKKLFNKQLSELESFILGNGAVCITSGKISLDAGVKDYPSVQQSVSKSTFIKNYMSPSLTREFNVSATIFYILSACTVLLSLFSMSVQRTDANVFLLYFSVFNAVLTVGMHVSKNAVVIGITALLGTFHGILYFIMSLDPYYLFFESMDSYLTEPGYIFLFVAMIMSIVCVAWLVTSVSMFITLSKTNTYYKVINSCLK